MSSFTTKLEYERLNNDEYVVTEPFGFYFTLSQLNRYIDKRYSDNLRVKLNVDIDTRIYINVPEGFITNFASVPKNLRWLFAPDGPWAKAAVIHDLLYDLINNVRQHDILVGGDVVIDMLDIQRCLNKNVSDAIFLMAMDVLNVNYFVSRGFYLAVKYFGKSHFRITKNVDDYFNLEHYNMKTMSSTLNLISTSLNNYTYNSDFSCHDVFLIKTHNLITPLVNHRLIDGQTYVK